MSHSQNLPVVFLQHVSLTGSKTSGASGKHVTASFIYIPFPPLQPALLEHESQRRAAAYKYSEKPRQGKNVAKTFD